MLIQLLISMYVSFAFAKPVQLNWLKFDYAPVYNVRGLERNKGIADVLQQSLKSCMKGYKHVDVKYASLPRIFSLLERADGNFCLPALGVFPGEVQKAHHSKLVFTIPTSILVIRKDSLKEMSKNGESVNLMLLLKNKKYVGGMVKGGTYGQEVKKVFNEVGVDIIERVQVDPAGFYRMLLMKRFDYVFDYPVGFVYNAKSLSKKERDQLTFLLIEENNVRPNNRAHALCSFNEFGKKAVREIDKCLLKKEVKESVTNEILHFLPKRLRARYKKLNMQMIGEKSIN